MKQFTTSQILLCSLALQPTLALAEHDIVINLNLKEPKVAKVNTPAAADADAPAAAIETDQVTRGYVPVPGGEITTPAFQYPIKPSDLKTPLAADSYMYTINTPGRYYIAADVSARVNINSAYTNVGMIYINSTDVTLDLNGKSLRPATGTNGTNQAGLTGIVVAASMSNIVIKNGQINGYGLGGTTSYITNGIVVLAGCRNVTLSDLQIANIGGANLANTNYTADVAGIAINPVTATTTVSRDIIIQNCNITNTSSSGASMDASGIYLNYVNNVALINCTVNTVVASGTGNPNTKGIRAGNCNTISLDGCVVNEAGGISGAASTGATTSFDLGTSSSAVTLNNCAATRMYGNTATYGLTNFELSGAGPYQLTNCLASNATLGSSATTGTVYGFKSTAIATYTNCSATSNTTAGVGGDVFGFHNTAVGSKYNNCLADNNTSTDATAATNNDATGFYTSGSSTQFNNCIATNNKASIAGACYGFSLTNASSCNLNNCIAGENTNLGAATSNVYGFYATGTLSTIFNKCVADHNNLNASSTSGSVYGFYLTSAQGTQVLGCQARNNLVTAGGGTASTGIGFYSTGGTSNEFNGCSAISNGSAVTSAAGLAAGINFVTENRSQIIGCDCSGNSNSGTTPAGTSAGIYLMTSCVNNTIKDNTMKFNVNSGSGVNLGAQLYFGFYDDAADTTSVLINNVAIGQGRCIALLTSSFQFPANTSMNYYFKFTGDQENPANMIHETDNFNWATVSTAVQNWSNISVAVGEVS